MERLTRLRELLFADEFSLGASKIPLIRQSNALKFRSFAENARWEVGSILFATINLPANNNHFRIEAGRNSEFEDRSIANRAWLHHIFAIAKLKKMIGIALICDGNPLAKPGAQHLFDGAAKHDGFAEIRQQLTALASKFPGRVLVIHNQAEKRAISASGIAWRGKFGRGGVWMTDWIKLTVQAENPEVFLLSKVAIRYFQPTTSIRSEPRSNQRGRRVQVLGSCSGSMQRMTAVMIAFFIIQIVMMMPMGAMHMLMGDFLIGRFPHVRHIQIKP